MTAALKASQLKVQLTVVQGPHVGQVFNLDKSVILLGRSPENDVILVNDPLVSRAHARIELIKNEFELTNLSEKNILLVHGDSVQKSIIVNDSLFQIGDTAIKFQFDLGQSVVSVPPKPRSSATLQIVKPKSPIAAAKPVALKPSAELSNSGPPVPKANRPQVSAQSSLQQKPVTQDNKRFQFYGIVAVLLLAASFIILSPLKGKRTKPKPLLKYEDEVAASLQSEPEDNLRKKRELERIAQGSPTVLRAEENFIKGMRDFQLGNYARAQDFFQVVLNLIPDHALARRHLYLSKVRFDELVQAKLILGESYYQKHNFNMCVSMYQQVINMLQGKSNDQKYKIAQRMAEKCQFASEGIQ